MNMTNMEKFSRNVLNELVFNVGEDEFKVKPQMKAKVELMEGLSDAKDNKGRITFITQFLIDLFKKDNADVDPKLIEEFVYANVGELQEQLMVKFKLVSKADLEDRKKQLSQSTGNN